MKRYGKAFWMTLLVKQNKHHAHSVLGHTLHVTYHLAKAGRWDLVPAGILHDIAKPLSAYQDEKDIAEGLGNYSFTNHETFGYHIIKNLPAWLVSDYTKDIVRYHYLIRGMYKAKERGQRGKYLRQKRIWDNLSDDFKQDLGAFLKADDKGKKPWL